MTHESSVLINLCSNCFVEVKNGKYHKCSANNKNATANPKDVMNNVITKLLGKKQDQLASFILKRPRTDDTEKNRRGEIILKTGGRDVNVGLNSKKTRTLFFR